jgi:hypothetical protein
MNILKINYIMIIQLIVLKIIDALLTVVGLSLGGIELNPLGFNFFTVFVGFSAAILLFPLNYWLRDDLLVKRIILITAIILSIPGFVAVIWNSIQLSLMV